jgi:hypothetical protein
MKEFLFCPSRQGHPADRRMPQYLKEYLLPEQILIIDGQQTAARGNT